jgi:hypothetical protein
MNKFLGILIIVILTLSSMVGCARAEFEVSPLISAPSEVIVGESFIVENKIANVGTADGVCTVTLKINDREIETREVIIVAGETETVSFICDVENSGTHKLELNGLTTTIKALTLSDIVEKVVHSLYDVNTYQFDMDMAMDMAGEAEGESFELTITLDSYGVFDLKNRLMRMDIIMTIKSPEEGEIDIGMEVYIVGNTEYIYMEMEGMEPGWVKSRMPVGTWKEMTQVEPQIELLEASQVELVCREKVRDVDCYVLKITPDIEKLWEIVMKQGELGGGQMPDISEEIIREGIRNLSARQWIDKETNFLTKAEVEMEIEITPEILGLTKEQGKFKMNIILTVLAYDYNQPVTIVVPPEAEEAIEY